MRREKTEAEYILWRAEMHLSHVRDGVYGNGNLSKYDKQRARKAMAFILRHRAKLILGDRREPVEIARTVFTYWRTRPRKGDSVLAQS